MKAPCVIASSLLFVVSFLSEFVQADSGIGSNPSGSYYHHQNPYTTTNQGTRYPDQRAYNQHQGEQLSLRKPESEVVSETIDKLPDGWLEYMDLASGKPYYYNVADRTTTWNRPSPVVLPASAPKLISQQQQQQ